MPRNSDDELESVVSLEDEDSEIETKIKAKTEKRKEKIPEGYVPVEISKKTGRPKRIMSEKQKLALAECRKKGREKRAQLAALRKQEKELKKDELLVKKLEVEAKVREHKSRLQQLALRAGYEPTEEEKKKIIKKTYKKHDHLEDDDYDKSKKSEIEELKQQLKKLQKKHKIVESESESESSDIEIEESPKPPIKSTIKPRRIIEPESEERYKPKKPTIKPVEKVPNIKERKKTPNPMMNYDDGDDNPAIKNALKSLFA